LVLNKYIDDENESTTIFHLLADQNGNIVLNHLIIELTF